ncbi:MAG: hypothetical protein KGV46_02930 [Pasteurella sp.]|nr:hypothetical protein [Pasteurella sp.]
MSKDKPKKRKSLLFRMFIFLIILVVFLVISMAVFATVPAEQLVKVQEFVDVMWWKASVIRWLILTFIIIKVVPWHISRQLNKFGTQVDTLQKEISIAESKNASYETLCELNGYLDSSQRMLAATEKLSNNRIYVGLALVAIELVAVQMPHFI